MTSVATMQVTCLMHGQGVQKLAVSPPAAADSTRAGPPTSDPSRYGAQLCSCVRSPPAISPSRHSTVNRPTRGSGRTSLSPAPDLIVKLSPSPPQPKQEPL